MFLQRQAVLVWSLLVVLLLIALVRADVNITLEDTASQIIYSPSACGLTLSSAGTETETCDSAWCVQLDLLSLYCALSRYLSRSRSSAGASLLHRMPLAARSPPHRGPRMAAEG